MSFEIATGTGLPHAPTSEAVDSASYPVGYALAFVAPEEGQGKPKHGLGGVVGQD